MKKQNIEDIFSTIENFSSVPPPELWTQIEEKLEKPKKKKRAILWWSVAATLLLGLSIPSVLNYKSNSNINNIKSNSSPTIVVKEKTIDSDKNPTASKDELILEKTTKSSQNQNAIVISGEEKTVTKSKFRNNAGVPSQKTLVSSDSLNTFYSRHNSDKGARFKNKQDISATEKGLASANNSKESALVSEKEKSKNSSVKTGTANVAVASLSEKSNTNSDKFVSEKESKNSPIEASSGTNKNIAVATKKGDSKIAENTSKIDSVQLLELQNIEKGLAKTESKKEKKDKEIKSASNAEKWSLAVFAGVANSENYRKDNSLGNAIDSKQSTAYGVKTNYKVNKKWAVSSGIKINELGQSIPGVSYLNLASDKVFLFSTSDYLNKAVAPANITANDNYLFVSNSAKNALKSNNLQSGNVDQRLKYIEMPLEVSYSLLNKNKTSISLNTGGFFGKLISNEVLLNGNTIGENLNANSFVYGSLLSSTVQYKLYKQTHIFVEPGMNYYINPVDNQPFNQFQWAFNFGLNVSF